MVLDTCTWANKVIKMLMELKKKSNENEHLEQKNNKKKTQQHGNYKPCNKVRSFSVSLKQHPVNGPITCKRFFRELSIYALHAYI